MNWQQLLNTYKPHDNSWIQNIYKLCKKWAIVHRRDLCCTGITSTQRSEGMNNESTSRHQILVMGIERNVMMQDQSQG
jgi:hypothetical protein